MYVYEAVQPVKFTPLQQWINRGKNKHYVVLRLKEAESVLTQATLKKMHSVGSRYKNKNYDWHFAWSDDKMYCSELVWKIYKEGAGVELSPLKKLREFNTDHPKVKAKLTERYGTSIPLEEQVVSPADLFNSTLLVKVAEG